MKPLPEQCKKAIEEQRCLGCTGLAEKEWTPPEKCPYILNIEQIKINFK